VGQGMSRVAALLSCGLLLVATLGLAACGSQTAEQTSITQSDTTSSEVATTSTSVPASTTTLAAPTTSARTTASSPSTSTSEQAAAVEYRNADYRFTFSLPESWKGYSIVEQQWEGFPNNTDSAGSSGAPVHGPEILIRHPKWTSSHPRQDIPIMVCTLAQWDQVQQETLTVGAAPIPPIELGRNATYVFALPARYNYAFPTGFEEVEKILEGKPLRAL
jgi:hypothetical protein